MKPAGPPSTLGKRAAVLAGALLLAVLPAPAAAPAGDSEDPVRLEGRPRVLVIGESLAVGTRPHLRRELHGWRVQHSVRISRNVPQGVEVLRRVRRPPGVVVMSVGTNDDPHLVTRFRQGVRQTLRIAGPKRCVVWPNIFRPPVGGAGYRPFNRILAGLDRRRNLRVVNWVRMVRRNRHWLGEDNVHVTPTGYSARARAIARAVRACRSSL